MEPDGDASIDAWAVEPVEGYVDDGGINLHYRDYGGAGDLLVFVPGFFMTCRSGAREFSGLGTFDRPRN